MTPLYLLLLQQALSTALHAVWPTVLVLLMVGLVTALVQASLQIEDATFALLPKSAVMILIGLTGSFGALPMLEGLMRGFILHAPALVARTWY